MNINEITAKNTDKELDQLERKLAEARKQRQIIRTRLVNDLKVSLEKVAEAGDDEAIVELLRHGIGRIRLGRISRRGVEIDPDVRNSVDSSLKNAADSISGIAAHYGVSASYVWMRKRALGLSRKRGAPRAVAAER